MRHLDSNSLHNLPHNSQNNPPTHSYPRTSPFQAFETSLVNASLPSLQTQNPAQSAHPSTTFSTQVCASSSQGFGSAVKPPQRASRMYGTHMPPRQGLGTGRMQKISGSGMQANPLPQVGLFIAIEWLQGRRVGSMGRPRPAVAVGGGALMAVC